jgi:UDP:flavonoid glycosyltransferase YjiC (YdhE family)
MISRYLIPTLRDKVDDLLAASRGVDLIVAPPEQFAASIVSELWQVPWVSVRLSPVSIPSAHVKPHPWPPSLPSPVQRVANRAQWRVASAVLRFLADGPINRVRTSYGLAPRRDLLTIGNLSPTYAAIAVSPVFMPAQPDWPPHLDVTGFCFWDGSENWSASAELDAFCEGSKPVIAVSSGSISREVGGVFGPFYSASIEAVRQVGGRALVIGAPAGSLPESLPEDVHALHSAPFSKIYPRCAAVIHHGGIGTTAQALRAGVPALVAPWGFDQYFTAAQVAQIGAGRWLSRRRFTSARAVRVLGSLLDPCSRYQDHTRQIASQIAVEDGVARLCARVESVLRATEGAVRPSSRAS